MCLTAFRPERTAALRVLLTATDHHSYKAKSNPKLADAIRNLGAVSGVVHQGAVTPTFSSPTFRWKRGTYNFFNFKTAQKKYVQTEKRTGIIKQSNCSSFKTMVWKTWTKIYQKGHGKKGSKTNTTICFIKYLPTFRETYRGEFSNIFFYHYSRFVCCKDRGLQFYIIDIRDRNVDIPIDSKCKNFALKSLCTPLNSSENLTTFRETYSGDFSNIFL